MAADWTGLLNNTATCVACKGITSCRASINAVETPILCYSEVMVMCDSARRERHVRAIISRCLCVALTKWLKRATTGCFSFKMLFSVIICVSGFIFSAFLRLVNMSVPFNPLLTQAPLQTALRLTERERERKCIDKREREHWRISEVDGTPSSCVWFYCSVPLHFKASWAQLWRYRFSRF